MTIPPPPYGGYPAAPQPPRKYRPSAGWFVGGIVLFVTGVVIGVGIFVWLISGFLDTDATLHADGEAHRVSVDTDGDRMLWLESSETTCRIVDLDTGERIEIRSVDGSYERSDSHGDLVGLYRFSPGSGNLEVTCAAPLADARSGDLVLIGQLPEIDNIVVGVLVMILVPGLLGLAGLVMLIWTGILWSLRDPRPKGA